MVIRLKNGDNFKTLSNETGEVMKICDGTKGYLHLWCGSRIIG